MYHNEVNLWAHEFLLIKYGIKLFQDYLEYYTKKQYSDEFYASLEMSLASFFIGFETCLDTFLLQRKKELIDSPHRSKLIKGKANLQEFLNILKENDFLWKGKKVDNHLIENIRNSYEKYRIKIFHPNSKIKQKRMFYPFSKTEYYTIVSNIFLLFKLIYHHSWLKKDIIECLEKDFIDLKNKL